LAANTAEGTVLLLSRKIGTEIDSLENAYYQIFPTVENLQSAQIVEDESRRLWAYIVKQIPSTGIEIKSVLPLTRQWFDDTKIAVDLTPWMPYEWWLLHNRSERLSHNQKQIARLEHNKELKIILTDGNTYYGKALRLTPYLSLQTKKDTIAFAVQDISQICYYKARTISPERRLLIYQIISSTAMGSAWLISGAGLPSAESLALIFASGVSFYLMTPPILNYILKKIPHEISIPLAQPKSPKTKPK